MRKYPHTNQWHINKLINIETVTSIPNYHEALRTQHTGEVVGVTWTQLHGLENTAHRESGSCNLDTVTWP